MATFAYDDNHMSLEDAEALGACVTAEGEDPEPEPEQNMPLSVLRDVVKGLLSITSQQRDVICMRQAGVPLAGSKRAQAPRRAAAEAIHAALAARRAVPEAGLAAMIADGFGADAAGEDRFDSLLGLLGALGVLDGAQPDFIPDDPWVQRWEGWVLGQTALPRDQGGA
jgi:hypothetical protein